MIPKRYTPIFFVPSAVKMSKPGLGYYETEDKVDLRIRDWVVQTPVAGFLYPSFNERSSDVNEALFFSKKPKEIDHCFIDDLMCCESGRSKSEKKVEFDSIVEKVLEEYRDAEEKIYSFHENLNALVDEREATESDEPLTAEEVLDAAQEAGFEEAMHSRFRIPMLLRLRKTLIHRKRLWTRNFWRKMLH